MPLTDLEIAQACVLKPMEEVAAKAGIPAEALEPYGRNKAKIDFNFIQSLKDKEDGKLILVTAINPTKAGEGKSTTTVGLADGLNALGYQTMVALREPSLGPVFGLKGGAAGGGYAQVVPMEDINLHFTGDMHAITTANNLLCAMIDNHMYQGNELDLDPENITFKRCLDMNDRTLRNVEIGRGARVNGIERQDGFNITVASEIMAALCLASDLEDLKERFASMLVGYTKAGKPVYVRDLDAQGAMAMVMKDAIKPNLVQTLEGNPALIHGGPFANIAHGCNSVIATKTALKLADYTVTEAGFGADLGAEKFLDIKCQMAGLHPDTVVIVATIRALKQHGGVEFEDLKQENVEAMLKGTENLAKHIDTIKQFGVPYIVAINQFITDTDAEIALLKKLCAERGVRCAESNHWRYGGEGAAELARVVVEACEDPVEVKFLYDLDMPLRQRVELIAKEVYGADGVIWQPLAVEKAERFESDPKYADYCTMMVKTHLSLSDDPTKKGVPTGWKLTIRDILEYGGAKFLCPMAGTISMMPGTAANPAYRRVDVDVETGKVSGLF